VLQFFHGLSVKAGAAIIASFIALSGAIVPTKTINITPAQTAIVSETPTVQPEIVSEASSTLSPTSTLIEPNLLPVVKVPPIKPKKLTEKATASSTPQTAQTVASTTIPTTPSPTVSIKIKTAEQLLNRTTLSLNQKIDGSYWVVLSTDLGGGNTYGWDLSKTAIGGNGTIPRFNVSYSCDPAPSIPPLDTMDVNPSFNVKTSYNCSIGLAGSDGQTTSKQFNFKTGGGRLVVTTATGMNTILRDGINSNGFVFNNQDSDPVNITGLTFRVSFTSLNTSTVPLILRFADPISGASLMDYEIDGLPSDPILTNVHSQDGVRASLVFGIPPSNQKMLMVQALGVQKFIFGGMNPEIKIMLEGITTDRPDVKIIFNSTVIDWTCTPMTQQYNPYSTSSLYESGQACTD